MSSIPYEKIQTLLCMCPKLLELEEPKLEEQVRGRVLELLKSPVPVPVPAAEPTVPAAEPQEPVEPEVEELFIKTIQGRKVAMNPKTNGCYEVLDNDEVGAWIGAYVPATGIIDRTEPDPDIPFEEQWMNLPALGKFDAHEQEAYRLILQDGERVCIANAVPKKDGSSNVLVVSESIVAINRLGPAAGFLWNGRLYQSATALLRATEEKKTTRTGNLHVCVHRKDDRDGLNKYFCMKVLSQRIRGY